MKSTTKYTKKHLLGHKSVLSLKTMYKILKEGYKTRFTSRTR